MENPPANNTNPGANEIIWDLTFEPETNLNPENPETKENFAIDLVDNSEFHILEKPKKNENGNGNEDWEIIDDKNISNENVFSHETLLSNRDTRNQIISNLYEVLY